MAFIDELTNLVDSDLNSTCCFFNLSTGIVVYGYKKLYELSGTKISVLCQDNKRLEICGNNLKVKELAKSEISLNGVITSLNVQ